MAKLLEEVPPFLSENRHASSEDLGHHVQVEMQPIVLKFVDLLYVVLLQAPAERQTLIKWMMRDKIMELLEGLRHSFPSIARHVAYLSDFAGGKDAVASNFGPDSLQTEIKRAIESLDSITGNMTAPDLYRGSLGFLESANLELMPLEPFVALLAAISRSKFLCFVPTSAYDSGSTVKNKKQMMSGLIHLGRTLPQLASEICSIFTDTIESLAILGGGGTALALPELAAAIRFAPDVFFLAPHSSIQQDLLVLLWKLKSNESLKTPAGAETDPSDSVQDVADTCLQQIVAAMASLRT